MNPVTYYQSWHGAKVTSPFGPRKHPVSGQPSQHNGIDFGGKPAGHIWTSPRPGTVTYVGDVGARGKLVVLKLADGYKQTTQHFGQILCKVGDKIPGPVFQDGLPISPGGALGTNGKTGNCTGVHLHYELRLDDGTTFGGKAIDPAKYEWEERIVDFVLVNTWADVPFAKRLMERKKAFMAWRNDAGALVGDLSQARTIYVCGGRVDDLPKGPQIVNLSGADAFATVANIGTAIKS